MCIMIVGKGEIQEKEKELELLHFINLWFFEHKNNKVYCVVISQCMTGGSVTDQSAETHMLGSA